MGDVVQLHRCSRCGAAGKRTELAKDGVTVAEFSACDACIDAVTGTLARVRPVFDAMLAVGIDREVANDAMTFLLERAGL